MLKIELLKLRNNQLDKKTDDKKESQIADNNAAKHIGKIVT